MKLNIVPARTGAQWVRAGVRTFFKQPLALAGLFFMFMAVISVLAFVPMIGGVVALMAVPALISEIHASTADGLMSPTGVAPDRGFTCTFQEDSSEWYDEGFRPFFVSSQASPSAPTSTRESFGSKYSPVAFDTVTEARNSSASFFVRKPRLSVCDLSGLR